MTFCESVRHRVRLPGSSIADRRSSMFAKIFTVVALSTTLTAGTALVTGAGAYAEQAPPGPRAGAEAVPSAKSGMRIGAGHTVPGQGWVPYGANGLYLDVNTTSGHFVGTPVYSFSIAGAEDHWALT